MSPNISENKNLPELLLSTQDGENWNFPCGTLQQQHMLVLLGTKKFPFPQKYLKETTFTNFWHRKKYSIKKKHHRMLYVVTDDIWFAFNEDEAMMMLIFSFIFLQLLTYTCIYVAAIKMLLCVSRKELNHSS